MNVDLKSLELFIRVAAVGAIGKAGSEFGLSSTAASHRIHTLEEHVGAKLFHRTTRTVSLSGEGETFLKHAKRILNTVEEALAEVQEDPCAISGELKIACSASFGRKLIAPFVTEFLQVHPRLSINLDSSDQVVDLIDGGYDLAIRLGTLAPSTLKARRIAASPRIMIAAPDYLERNGCPQNLDDLSAHNCLMRGDIKSWKLQAPDGLLHDVKVTGNYCSNSAEAVTEATVTVLGIARKCHWEVADYLETGQLVQILTDHTVAPAWNVYAVRSPAPKAPARVTAFTRFLEEKLSRFPALQA